MQKYTNNASVLFEIDNTHTLLAMLQKWACWLRHVCLFVRLSAYEELLIAEWTFIKSDIKEVY
jgi:hypothetical protein